MSDPTLGPLVPADETFNHQITDTFATVSQSDRSWTEKVCAMACARDGSLQLGFGIGKYPNRDVIDAYAGVSRGVEQWTVRASSRPRARPRHRGRADPLRGRRAAAGRAVPARAQRRAARSRSSGRSTAAVPPFLEDREHHREPPDGAASTPTSFATTRSGVAHGWAEVDGDRVDVRERRVGLHPRPLVGGALPGGRPARRRP